MDIFNADLTQALFTTAIQRTAQLESLANNALKNGIDRYIEKDYEGAAIEFKRAIGLAPNSTYAPDAADYLANAYLQLGDTESALNAYKTAIRLNPFRDDMHGKLGNLYYAEERYQEAESAYKEAVRINPTANNYYALGQVYLSTERYQEAENQFNEVHRLEPNSPNGNFGVGLALSMQGRYEDAIRKFEETIEMKEDFYDAHAEMGYAYADLGEMDKAQEIVDFLESKEEDTLADTLSRYMYKVDPPKIMFAQSGSTFPFLMAPKSPLSALDAYLANPDASKTFTMVIQFDKEMDRESVENIMNWQISRAIGQGPGQAYNFSMPIPSTEITVTPIPDSVYYNEEKLTATVYFKIQQNAAADGTIDPLHIEFKFNGKDIYGLEMDPNSDQFTGFSGAA
ncbi:MAG: tetratricopeptide repeat protein [Desulfobacterales bacterium]|jgi:tetratricopeptide (TPR) repeat protein